MLFRSGVSAIACPFPTDRRTIALLTLCSLLVAGCDRQKAADGQGAAGQANVSAPQAQPLQESAKDLGYAHIIDRSRAGRPAPTTRFTGPDDDALTLADFRGKPLLVNFWATWCAPCVAEMPTLDRLAARSVDRLSVIAVAQDRQGAAIVDPWFRRARLTRLLPYLDPDSRLLGAAGGAGLPVTILYDAQGREVWRVVGALDWTGADARALLSEAGV
jgi:thiol-disulfide isomerase/thioredoxin